MKTEFDAIPLFHMIRFCNVSMTFPLLAFGLFVGKRNLIFRFECLLRLTLNTIEDLCVLDLWMSIGVLFDFQKGKLSVHPVCVN